tara:strand:- start:684 stop:932 length:249 start_codon:yes stop_codon:yes gene_type:complete
MKISNIVNTLLTQALGPESAEVTGSYNLCIPCEGSIQKYETTSLVQAEIMLRDWLSKGWPAWIEDNDGAVIHSIAQQSNALN